MNLINYIRTLEQTVFIQYLVFFESNRTPIIAVLVNQKKNFRPFLKIT